MKNVKSIMIIGDSYSTFEGYIPDGYASYYKTCKRPETDVTRVEETWWYKLTKELNLNLVLNNSWSGSTVGYRGYGNADCSHTSSFIFRLSELEKNGFFESNSIDTVFIFGATNDSWANVELGEAKFDGFCDDDLFYVLPAVCFIIKRLKEILPSANIVYIINTGLKPEIAETVKLASEHFGTEYIELKDIDKQSGHPTIRGMEEIKNQVADFLRRV